MKVALITIALVAVNLVLVLQSGRAIVELVQWALQSGQVAMRDVADVTVFLFLFGLSWRELRRAR